MNAVPKSALLAQVGDCAMIVLSCRNMSHYLKLWYLVSRIDSKFSNKTHILTHWLLGDINQRLNQLSQLFSCNIWAVRIQLTHFSYNDCENTCKLSYYHHQIGIITHLPLFMVRSWKNGMHFMSFCILIFNLKLIFLKLISGTCTLAHWGQKTHICVGKLTIIASDNGLSPGRRQAIIWTNAMILLIGPLGTNFSEILGKIHSFSFKRCIWKCRLRNGVYLVSASMS